MEGQLHSCAEEFLKLFFDLLSEKGEFLLEILEYTVAHITGYVRPQKSHVFWSSIVTASQKSTENWKQCGDERYSKSLENLLKLLGQAIEHKDGKILYNVNKVIPEIVALLSLENLPENVIITAVKVVIVILLSNNLKLSQEEASFLVKNTLAVKKKEAILYFVDNITEFPCFEPLILPHFLKLCEENQLEKDYLRILTNVTLKKAPISDDGIKLRNWSKYPLVMKSNKYDEIEDALLKVIEEGMQDKERLFCTLVCIPHFKPREIEKFKECISKSILSLLEKCDKTKKEIFFFLNLHIECLLHLNEKKFFIEHFQEITNNLLLLVDENSILFILKIMSLLIVAVENQELINIKTLDFVNKHLEPYFCSPFHEVSFPFNSFKIFLFNLF